METPILTKNQQKRALSGKKKPREKCLRNVLLKPSLFTNLVADETVAQDIFKTLESTITVKEDQMPADVENLECDQPKRKTGKNKRQRLLKEKGLSTITVKEEQMPADVENLECDQPKRQTGKNKTQRVLKAKGLRKYLCLGVNEVARAVESGHVLSVLLEKDVDPQFMVSHIGTSCAVHNIPCIILSGLRNGTRKAFGFPCICLGLKVAGDNEDYPFAAMNQCVLEAFQALSLNKAPTELKAESPVSAGTARVSEVLENVEAVAKPDSDNKSVPNDRPFTTFYRYRTNIKERVFKPKGQKQATDEFISVGSADDDVTTLQSLKGISVNFSSLERINLKSQKKLETHSQTDDFDVEYRIHEIKRVRPNPDKKKKLKVKKIKTVK